MPIPNRSDVCAPAGRTPVLVSSTTAATTKRRTFRIVILRESRTSGRLGYAYCRLASMLGFPPSMRVLLIILCLGAAAASAAQDTTIRLQGEGRLGPPADEFRGTSAAYGYEGTPYSVVPAMIELARIGGDDVVYEPGCGD